jgi:hypothetical protein
MTPDPRLSQHRLADKLDAQIGLSQYGLADKLGAQLDYDAEKREAAWTPDSIMFGCIFWLIGTAVQVTC